MFLEVLRGLFQNLYGTSFARAVHEKEYQLSLDYQQAINALDAISNVEPRDDKPIFIFSAGWRSGSTLLQRLICSSDEVLIWGEIYDRCNIIQNFAKSVTAFSDSWPNENYIKQPDSISELSGNWLANLYPHPNHLKASFLNFLDLLLHKPALELGAKTWGMKEVRFGLREALFLKWLYPNARFLFIQRELEDAFLSYKKFCPQKNWYSQWPEQKAFTPFAFARHRSRLLSEFNIAAQETGGLMIEYSDLVSGDFNFGRLNEYCEINVDQSILKVKVGSGEEKAEKRDGSNKKGSGLSQFERFLLRIGDSPS